MYAIRSYYARIPIRQFLQDRTILLILIITFTVSISFSALQATFSLFTDRVVFPDVASSAQVARNVSLMLTLMGFAVVLTQVLLIKPLVTRFGERRSYNFV